MKTISNMQKVISKDGTAIGYYKNGTGPSLFLVHGTTADHSRWVPISPRFEQRFTVFTMDRRGRGGSGDSSRYDIIREAEDVAAVIEAIGGPVFLLGHSNSGICCLEASLITGKVSRLILYEPLIPTCLPLYPPAVPDRIQSLVDSSSMEAGLEEFSREVVKAGVVRPKSPITKDYRGEVSRRIKKVFGEGKEYYQCSFFFCGL